MPRRRKPLAGCFCARTGKADLKKSATSLAAFLALTDLGWTGWTFGTGRPSRCGSASVKGRLMGDAAEEEAVGPVFLRQDGQAVFEEVSDQFGGFPGFDRFGLDGLDFRDGQALAVRVGIGQGAADGRCRGGGSRWPGVSAPGRASRIRRSQRPVWRLSWL